MRAVLALSLGIAVAACHSTEQAAAPNAAPVAVRVGAVRRGPIEAVLRVTGETAALSVLRLASPIAGRITFLSAQAGDRLAKGQVLARLMSLEDEAALNGFRFLDGAGALNADGRALARRLQRKLGHGGLGLPAPFAGVVSARFRNPGEQVAAGEVLLEIFDPQSLFVLAQVPVDAAADLRGGMPVEVDLGRATVTGQVGAVLPAMTSQALTVPVRITLMTPLQLPLLGAAVDCRITVAEHPEALLIPRSALVSSTVEDHGVVMVAIGNHVHRREVKIGLHTPDTVEITDGLTAGELVVVDGQYGLPDGQQIHLPAVAGA